MITISRNRDSGFFAGLNQCRASLYRNLFAIYCEFDFGVPSCRGSEGSARRLPRVVVEGGSGAPGGAK